ncbi:MAG: response regulator [Rhodospirillales bacterium]
MSGHRIIVADDDELIVRLLQHKLSQRGIEVLTADDGDEAWRLAQQVRPDLVILDGMMPGMDGVEVLQRIKQDPRTATVPVMLLSARDSGEDVVEALELGADEYMVKPFMPEELWARVRKILDI